VMTKAVNVSTARAVCVFRLARAGFKFITEMSVSVLSPTHICYEHQLFISNSESD
jgi:hypothetical protein